MARSNPWIWSFWSLASLGSVLLIVGAAMPTIAMEWMYDRPAEAQSKVDGAQLGLIVIALHLGTEVHVFGTVRNVSNISDFDFIPDGFPIDFAILEVEGFSGLIVFINSIGLRSGETAVAEGFYYGFTYENVSYALVLGSSLWAVSLAAATGLASGLLQPAKVFRPWWDQTAFAMVSTGATLSVAAAYAFSRRDSAPDPPAAIESVGLATGGSPPPTPPYAPPPPP